MYIIVIYPHRYIIFVGQRIRIMTDLDTHLESPYQPIGMDFNLIDDIEIDGIDHSDYPDYCDAYISNATYDGKKMTEEQLDIVNGDSMFVHEEVMKHIF